MSFARSCHFRRRNGPRPRFEFEELISQLPSLGLDHLVEMTWIRVQSDEVLAKLLFASISIRMAPGDSERAKQGIDYAFHFPESIRYTDRGYGLIIWGIQSLVIGRGTLFKKCSRFSWSVPNSKTNCYYSQYQKIETAISAINFIRPF